MNGIERLLKSRIILTSFVENDKEIRLKFGKDDKKMIVPYEDVINNIYNTSLRKILKKKSSEDSIYEVLNECHIYNDWARHNTPSESFYSKVREVYNLSPFLLLDSINEKERLNFCKAFAPSMLIVLIGVLSDDMSIIPEHVIKEMDL